MSEGHLTAGLEAFERKDWTRAFDELEAAASESNVGAGDLERLGIAAHLVGREDECSRAWAHAHEEYLAAGEPAAAARCAFQLAMTYRERGQLAHFGGWLARAQRLVEGLEFDCPERGYTRVPEAQRLLEEDPASARAIFEEILDTGRRCHDPSLAALAHLGLGTVSIRLGSAAEGTAHLDEAMVGVIAGEVSPIISGVIYCSVISVCHEVFDLARAQEWSAASLRWCESQPGLVPFRGQCQVHRAELLQLHGDWPRASEELRAAERNLAGPPSHPAIGQAYYRQGELHRLRGALGEANEAYRKAEQWGWRPEPGRALLRLAQGRPDAALNAIRHALNETTTASLRAPMLAAAVEILISAEDLSAAGAAAEELVTMATAVGAPSLKALAHGAQGAVAIAAGDAMLAATELRASLELWQTLGAPYEAARMRVLLAKAAQLTGDSETTEAQLQAARDTFEDLGATLDLRAIAGERAPSENAIHGLTSRELEVLRLIATGMTNRAIATTLSLSEKTVANHVGNILGKLQLSSRAAATAYAYEHGLA